MKSQTKQFKDDKHKEKILDRIQKLLNVADGTKYEAEADTAMKMAQSYMKQFGLNMTDVELAKELEGEIIELDINEHSKMKNPEKWSGLLAKAVCIVFDVDMYRYIQPDHDSSRYGANKSHFRFVGYKADTEFAKIVFSTLYVATRAAACKEIEQAGKPRLSFMFGVAERLWERARAEKEEAKKEPSGRFALVVRSKKDSIKDYLKANRDLKSGSNRGNSLDEGAYNKGRKHGGNMDLMNKEKVQSQPTAAIGYNK